MTKPEAIKYIQGITYDFKSDCRMWNKLYPFKNENLELLREVQKEIPALRIYEKANKFMLVRDIYGTPVRDSWRGHDYEGGVFG